MADHRRYRTGGQLTPIPAVPPASRSRSVSPATTSRLPYSTSQEQVEAQYSRQINNVCYIEVQVGTKTVRNKQVRTFTDLDQLQWRQAGWNFTRGALDKVRLAARSVIANHGQTIKLAVTITDVALPTRGSHGLEIRDVHVQALSVR